MQQQVERALEDGQLDRVLPVGVDGVRTVIGVGRSAGGVPLTATAAGWLVAWREPPAIARPVIE